MTSSPLLCVGRCGLTPDRLRHHGRSRDSHAEVGRDESPPIGGFFDPHLGRFAAAVPGLRLHPYEHRRVPLLHGLQPRGVLEGVAGHHSVVVIRSVTERPEAVDNGNSTIAGTDPVILNRIVDRALHGMPRRTRPRTNPFGDGFASERVAEAVAWRLGHLSLRPVDWHGTSGFAESALAMKRVQSAMVGHATDEA